MRHIILFQDAAGADPDTRKRHMADHLAFLERNADLIEAAGPLKDTEGQGRDGLWIVQGADVERIEQLIREDPFWSTGLRGGYAILPWTQVFANGVRQIA